MSRLLSDDDDDVNLREIFGGGPSTLVTDGLSVFGGCAVAKKLKSNCGCCRLASLSSCFQGAFCTMEALGAHKVGIAMMSGRRKSSS